MSSKRAPMSRQAMLKHIVDYLLIVAGCALYGLSFNLFLQHNNIAPGGLTGIAMIICDIIGFKSVGTVVIIFNIPLFIAGWKLIGSKFVIGSIAGTFLSAVAVDLFAIVGYVETEPLLAAVFGGLMNGIGIGLVMSRGATTGGTDIAARLIKLRLAHVPIGRIVMALDMVVVIAAGIAYANINSSLYAIIVLFVASASMDWIIYGTAYSGLVYVISDKSELISQAICSSLGRGVTILEGKGAYTGSERKVILCAIKKQQLVNLKRLVREIDPGAFIIVSEAREVLGIGFGKNDPNML